MRCPNCLYENHEQVEICERCGESLRGENKLFNTCPSCGYINETGADFCESCGEAMSPSGLRKSARKKFAKKQRRARKVRTPRSGGGCSSGLFLLILIFIAFFLLGLIQGEATFEPAEVAEPETLLVLRGTSDLGLAEGSSLNEFSARAIDPAGVNRLSLYVDGQLVGAQNYGANNQADYTPGLGSLSAGDHTLFIRSVNAEGKTAYSQVITVHVTAGGGGAFSLPADPKGSGVPTDIRLNNLLDGKRIGVSWETKESDIDSVRIYARPPGSSGLVYLADIDGEATQYDFPVEREGRWEVYLSYLNSEGYEGELGFADLVVGVDVAAPEESLKDLPAPIRVGLVVRASDCQQAASQLGAARDEYYAACLSAVNDGQHTFLVWDWPIRWQDGVLYTRSDVLGFELKLVLMDADGTALGERVTAIPFSKIRGAIRTSQEINCGVQRSWYVRAVGPESVSDWSYAGSVAAENCAPEKRIGDGCAGQADAVVMSALPGGFMPDLFFKAACEGLDLCYADGAIGQPKVGCDNLYHSNLLAICAQKEGLVDYGICKKVAEDFYNAANRHGSAYYPMGATLEKCFEADHIAGCFTGNLSAMTNQSGDKVRAATIWVGRAAWTGLSRFGQGVIWVVDRVIEAFD
ncbi:zinc ribbon domain-containing protein [Chloroflexota bacterium]|nr:zinc ribbon domain-containing protein [Chloroflexota bacterium]